ncbi:MAG: hypothetical protein ABII12_07150 [Planctomycetota bacterium]
MDTAGAENQFQIAFVDLAFQLIDTMINVLAFLMQNVLGTFFSAFLPA